MNIPVSISRYEIWKDKLDVQPARIARMSEWSIMSHRLVEISGNLGIEAIAIKNGRAAGGVPSLGDHILVEQAHRIAQYGRASKPTVQCDWKTQSQCLAVVKMLDECSLRGRKAQDYELWREAVLLWTDTNIPSEQRQERLKQIRSELKEIKKYQL